MGNLTRRHYGVDRPKLFLPFCKKLYSLLLSVQNYFIKKKPYEVIVPTKCSNNESIPTFYYRNFCQCHKTIKRKDWLLLFDLADAFFHLWFWTRDHKFLNFHINGQRFRTVALLFGYKGSPYHFSVFMALVAKFL